VIRRLKTENSEKGRRREREDNCEFRIADCEFERQRTEGGGQEEIRGQRLEVGDQKRTEDRKKLEVRDRRSEVSRQREVVD